ncbi:alpha/beta fold hydrolase [Negadavirga shengliensis]|uniref:Alpha/beta fold hydrolase n=1 Tax=Negadavirga shengliensis TaxID=1389218 RepID=A0ABV9SXC6_9BACT
MSESPLLTSRILIMPLLLLLFFTGFRLRAQDEDTLKRQQYLDELLKLNRPHPTPTDRPRNVQASFVTLSHKDSTWYAWQQRTGELPPDFDAMPSLPFLPDPLIWDEGGENIPITSEQQWSKKRDWISDQVKYFLSGTFPDPPQQLDVKILEEKVLDGIKLQTIELRFGPDDKAKLTLEVFTPPGEGPFPVFMSQWNHRGWVQIAVRRGYMGVIYAGADSFDETIHYQELYPDHDWSALMTRAWGAHRAVDYLYTLSHVDKDKIALTGHSRNAKLSLFAAAFDNRITAVISSSGGTGGEIPYRYTDERHENESIDYLNSIRPQWFHPRLRFFNGREHKLPIDQNALMALIAPNALLLSSSIREAGGGDPWAIEQNLKSLKKVYGFLGASDKVDVRFRDGEHGVSARDIEGYVDWLDIQFGRSEEKWSNPLYYDYDFDTWKAKSGASVDSSSIQALDLEKELKAFNKNPSQEDLRNLQNAIRDHIKWTLGDQPPGVPANPISSLSNREDYIDLLLRRPVVKNGKRMNIAPYEALGDYQYGAIYCPTDKNGKIRLPPQGKLPVVIFHHKYVNTGFDRGMDHFIQSCIDRGIAVFTMDLLGYGSRIEEGTGFYKRYPEWSKMGKMVMDTRAAIDALAQLDFVDSGQIYLAGYALGGTVSLITGALDDRVAGVALAAAFTPLRSSGGEMEGIKAYSHLYGLLPKWGLFEEAKAQIPVDFPEMLAAIAPKPLLIVSPELDRHADLEAVRQQVSLLQELYQTYGKDANLEHQVPESYNRFTREQQDNMVEWLHTHIQNAGNL